jgi:MFS family permease
MGQAMGMYHTALIFGTLISPGLGGLITDAAGWRVAFFVCAFAALTSVGVTLTVLRRVPGSRAVTKPAASADGRKLTYRSATVLIWPALVATFGIFFIRNALGSTVFPLYGRDEVGLAAGQLGAILTLNAIISATLTTPAGMAADRWGSRALLYPGFAFAAAGGLILMTVDSLAGFAFASAVFSLASLNNSVPSSMIAASADAGSRGMLLGIYRFVGDLGFTVGPITMGFVLNAAGFDAAAWMAAAVAASVIAVIAVHGRASQRRPAATLQPVREEQRAGS